MNDPRSEQYQFYAWLLGVFCGAVAVLVAVAVVLSGYLR